MNIDNINLLIKTLEDEQFPDGKALTFDMASWIKRSDCGTVACIAGTAAILGGMKDWRKGSIRNFAENWLDINSVDSYKLFLWTGKLNYDEVTRDVAVACLKRFRDTGTVVWLPK